eukprot:SAG31_NODE_3036_length_4763_cov_3.456046_5_plen_60_part_00
MRDGAGRRRTHLALTEEMRELTKHSAADAAGLATVCDRAVVALQQVCRSKWEDSTAGNE